MASGTSDIVIETGVRDNVDHAVVGDPGCGLTAILDGDEMLSEDPKPLLQEAKRRGFDKLNIFFCL